MHQDKKASVFTSLRALQHLENKILFPYIWLSMFHFENFIPSDYINFGYLIILVSMKTQKNNVVTTKIAQM